MNNAESKTGGEKTVESDFETALRRWSAAHPITPAVTARDRVLDRLPRTQPTVHPRRSIALAAAVLAVTALVSWWPRSTAVELPLEESPIPVESSPTEVQALRPTDRPAPTQVVVTLSSGTEVYIALGST